MRAEAATPRADLTALLTRWREGDRGALEELVPAVYQDLRRLARAQFANEPRGQTLEPTAVVHEAFLRLGSYERISWRNRVHFFSVAARIMRRVLVDHARKQRAVKRGGSATRVTLSEALADESSNEVDLLALDQAMTQLSDEDPRGCRVVEMRYFGGLDYEEIAEVLDVSVPTVKRDWNVAKLWLRRALTAST